MSFMSISSSDFLRELKRKKWNKPFDLVKVDQWQNRHPITKITKKGVGDEGWHKTETYSPLKYKKAVSQLLGSLE